MDLWDKDKQKLLDSFLFASYPRSATGFAQLSFGLYNNT